MTFNFVFSRPTGVAMVLALIGLVGTTTLWLAATGRDALVEERDAKAGFVARSLATVPKLGGGTAPSKQSLAIEADSATLAAARIDARVRSLVTGAGGIVLSSRSESRTTTVPGSPPSQIEIQAVVHGSIDVLQMILYRLESEDPMILVDALDLRLIDGEGEPAKDEKSPVLSATVTLSAFWTPSRP